MRTPIEEKRKNMERLRKLLERKPRTLEEMQKAFGVGRKTIYRWMETLEDNNVKVVTVGFKRPRRYAIL